MDLPVTVPLSNDLDVFVFDNFFSQTLINQLWTECLAAPGVVDFVDHHGIFKGNLIAKQTTVGVNQGPALVQVLSQIAPLFDHKILWSEIVFSQLHLPWDIHCDLLRKHSSKPPLFNLLVPLQDVDSRTILFNETSTDTNDFWKYKQTAAKASNPVSKEIWNKHLSMCWPEDREWLSIRKILPAQAAGQLIGFKRNIWHSSDNFHLNHIKSKSFLQILVDLDS